MKLLSNNRYQVFLVIVCLLFFWPFILKGKIPLPADTIVGMYHPWRDVVWNDFIAGVPFKNYLITDPVRQQFLWKKLAIERYKQLQWPLWNPYTHSGMPLLANFQTGAFYPANFIFFALPFNLAWGVYIFIQPVLAGLFTYWFLRHLKLQHLASLLGGIVFAFSGFMTTWLEWGNIGHTILWLPLILLSIEKLIKFCTFPKKHLGWWPSGLLRGEVSGNSSTVRGVRFRLTPRRCLNRKSAKLLKLLFKKSSFWPFIFLFSLTSQFFAGHLQTSFYVVLFSLIYLVFRLLTIKRKSERLNFFLLFTIYYLLFTLITAVQWLPTLELIQNSSRGIDQAKVLSRSDWFLPFKHLVQLIAPDFFGNPTTLNYWGEWNYGEFVSFIGIIPFFFVLLSVFSFRRNNLIKFFLLSCLVFLSFALPTPWAKFPFWAKIPLIGSAQPSRLIGLVDFFLAVLSAFGFNQFLKKNDVLPRRSVKEIFLSFLFIFILISALWLFVFQAPNFFPNAEWLPNLAVSKRNLILPTTFLGGLLILLVVKNLLQRLQAESPAPLCAGMRRRSAEGGVAQPRRKKPRPSVVGESSLFGRHIKLQCMIYICPLLFFLLTVVELFRFGWKFTPFSPQEWIFPQTKTVEFLQKDSSLYRFLSVDRRLFPSNFAIAYNLQTISGYDPLYLKDYAALITKMEFGKDAIVSFNRIIEPTNYASNLVDQLNVKYILSLQELESDKLVKVYQEGQTRIYQNLKAEPLVKLLPSAGNAKILEYQPNKIKIEVEDDAQNDLVLANMYYPGWQVTVNGRHVKLEKTEENFKKVRIEKGKNIVEFYYLPESFLIGLIISIFGLLFVAILVMYPWSKFLRLRLSFLSNPENRISL